MADEFGWLNPIVDAITSHALSTGRFEQFNGHEPRPETPMQGIVGACWPQGGATAPRASGMRSTSLVLTMQVRLYTSGQAEPRDDIDPGLIAVVAHLLDEYQGDFTLGGLVRNVDVFGEHAAQRLGFQAGWIPSTQQRIMTITLPLVLSDLWQQRR